MVAVAAVVTALAAMLLRPHPDWVYSGQFHAVIKDADRIVVRDGGYDWPDAVAALPVLFEINDSKQVNEVRQRIVFERNQYADVCGCHGYPVIEWYQGETRIVLVSLQHGEAIRWGGFSGDAYLTRKSGQWIVQWLIGHGVPKPELQ